MPQSKIDDHVARVVANVATLFVSNPQADDDDIVNAAVAAGIDRLQAELAVAFLPAAFGRAVIRENTWSADLPDEFRVEDRVGKWVRFRLSDNPTYRAAADLAEHQRVAHRPAFSAVARRSAELGAISHAFSAGSDVRGGVFSPIALIRLSAEEISQRRLRWWNGVRRGAA